MTDKVENALDEVFMTEDNISRKSYEEGIQQGLKCGQSAGYEFGYLNGLKIGKELATYFTISLINLERNNNSKLTPTLLRLVTAIKDLPLQNKENINEEIDKIKLLYKLIQSSYKETHHKSEHNHDKLSF